MNSSYKIALIASVVVCVVVIGYYTAQRRTSPSQAGAASQQQELDGNTPAGGEALSSASGTSTERSGSSARSGSSDTTGSPISRTIVPIGQGSPTGRSGSAASGSGSGGAGGYGTPSYDAPQDRVPPRAITSGTSNSGGSGAASSAAPAPAPAPSPAPAGQTYVIKPGDNFHALAKRLYGSDKHWVDIAQANPSIDPIRLKVGQTIRLPAIATVAPNGSGGGSGKGGGSPGAASVPGAAAPKSLIHIVKPGETLASISKRYYKTTDKWEMLFRVNRETVGADPDDLEAGMKITIPPAE